MAAKKIQGFLYGIFVRIAVIGSLVRGRLMGRRQGWKRSFLVLRNAFSSCFRVGSSAGASASGSSSIVHVGIDATQKLHPLLLRFLKRSKDVFRRMGIATRSAIGIVAIVVIGRRRRRRRDPNRVAIHRCKLLSRGLFVGDVVVVVIVVVVVMRLTGARVCGAAAFRANAVLVFRCGDLKLNLLGIVKGKPGLSRCGCGSRDRLGYIVRGLDGRRHDDDGDNIL
mmetsp:Transcript_122521/g.183218  ORF Transcript_122521/g.183218 Transcript_122521/m.183218 type:complete len:224 (+) Transcript_122521:59-730(+)